MKNLISVERRPGREYQLIPKYPDGTPIPGVSRITLVTEPKNFPVLHIELVGFEFLGEEFPEAGINPEVSL
jgi:hypothetical protein